MAAIQTFVRVSPAAFAAATSSLRQQLSALPTGACIEFFDNAGTLVALCDQAFVDFDLLLVEPGYLAASVVH